MKRGNDFPGPSPAPTEQSERDIRAMGLELEHRQAMEKLTRDYDLQKSQIEARLQEAQAQVQAQQAEAEARRTEITVRWSLDRIRGLVSLLLVAGFLLTSGIVIVLNAFGNATTDLLQNVTSLYSGITGAILGYYFGRQQT